MQVVIRTDSSTVIGSGHLMRCLTLAGRRQRADGAEVHFICRDLPGNLSHLVPEGGYRLHLLPRHDKVTGLSGYAAWLTVPQEVDAEETVDVLESLGQVDCLVVDSYALDASWESRMRHFAKEIFVIDDLADRKHDCDVLLDQNFYLDKGKRYDGLVPEDCRMLLGPAHALLREEFYEVGRHRRKRRGELKNLLIFYGGSDLTNETCKAVRAVLRLSLPEVQIHVVVGGSNPHKKEVETLCRAHGFLHYHEQVDNMAELMNAADIMLGAGGTTTWERCFLGLPSIVTAIADNQVKICEDCHTAGLIDYLGFYDAVSEQDIAKGLLGMDADRMRRMTARCLRIFDEKGLCDGELEVAASNMEG
ncbi:MAG: UDP-2,4-diacetamido-2,4,6-trideoxy-beta-L-altropyranose hydrolase [Selenomonadaceae bacterium]|nr:UDP-2,4-diacetamido-2,4,6-trideoxy-beta-L-altropyranose hydrolase [Selenomonadaceae bacterium]